MTDLAAAFRDHETHRHEWYGLTCEVFDQMLAICDYSCRVCGCPSPESSCGKLVIDHDGTVGNWAVRGLLCTRCNATLRVDRPDPEWALPYLADPWWKRMLAEKGLAEEPPEPTDWSIRDGYLCNPQVRDFGGQLWTRSGGEWRCGLASSGKGITWHGLLRLFGPHNLTVHAPGGTIIPARQAEEMRGGRSPLEIQGLTPEQCIDIALVLLRKGDWPVGTFERLQEVVAALQGKTVAI